MSIARILLAAVLLACAACAPMTAPSGTSPSGDYTDREWSYRVAIPDGWRQAALTGEATEKLHLQSGDGRADVRVHVVPTGTRGCRIAIEEWLPAAKSAAFRTTFDRSVRISGGELSTVKGAIETLDGERSGELSAFCERGSAVIAVGLGRSHHAEIAMVVSSFRYLDRTPPAATPTPVVKKKPTVKKKPPVRATRPPRATPTARPQPTATPEPEPEGEDELRPPR